MEGVLVSREEGRLDGMDHHGLVSDGQKAIFFPGQKGWMPASRIFRSRPSAMGPAKGSAHCRNEQPARPAKATSSRQDKNPRPPG